MLGNLQLVPIMCRQISNKTKGKYHLFCTPLACSWLRFSSFITSMCSGEVQGNWQSKWASWVYENSQCFVSVHLYKQKHTRATWIHTRIFCPRHFFIKLLVFCRLFVNTNIVDANFPKRTYLTLTTNTTPKNILDRVPLK